MAEKKKVKENCHMLITALLKRGAVIKRRAGVGEDWGNMKFYMKAVRFTKTTFERQVLESVVIHENRGHNPMDGTENGR